MYPHLGPQASHPKRRKKRPIHGMKTVDVTRGKSGYGFTISGQHPCVLSVIVPGSPADVAGLKTGDYVVSVNNQNVTKFPHDDVVRMVGISTGTLTLQVAENYNSSDSSDDEYHHRNKARYPNRVRPRHASSRHSEKILGECNQKDKHAHNDYKHKDPHWSKSDLKVIQGQSRVRLHEPVGAENVYSSSSSSSLSTPKISRPLSVEKHGYKTHDPLSLQLPRTKQAVVKSTSQSAKSSQKASSQHDRHMKSQSSGTLHGSFIAPGISSFLKTSAHQANSANNAFIAMDDDEEDGDDEDSLLNCSFHDMRVIVGYIGSIEMPSDANKPHIRLQSIRNAVRRLRVEQKIHTLVLMEISQEGVKLTNGMGTTVAHYPVERLAFSGVCPDDKRFFGIVTLHSVSGDEMSDGTASQEEESASSGSCHVFMVDPEMRFHNIHAQKAKTFGITCTTAPDRHHQERSHCTEFPRSATPIIVSITNLYKDRPAGINDNEVALSQAFADPSREPRRSVSNSSNSDSGLGLGRHDPGQVHGADAAVRLPENQAPNPPQAVWQNPSFPLVDGPVQHCSPGVQTMPTPLRDAQLMPAPSSVFRRLNRSNSSDDCSTLNKQKDKFSIRAMPDPLNTSRFRAFSSLKGNKSYQANDSDHESNSSKNSDMFRSFSHSDLQRPVSVPPRTMEDSFTTPLNNSKVEKVEMEANKKLSPRAHLPPFHQLRSPSAPPTLHQQPDSDVEDFDFPHNNSGMGGLIERFEQDHALRISSPADVTRRYSEGYSLAIKRDKDRTPEDGDKWLKPNTIRHRRASRLQAPLSHSHESLIALEHDHQGHRISAAGSVNNINSPNSDDEEDLKVEEIGRVAGWAVNFEKLLKDGSGLVIFTEFLKKEFSQENIIFWKAVEQYKKVVEADKRKARAKEIFTKHVSVKATDPINIEQNARQQVEKQLDNPSTSTFDRPQQEIFKLMKQDSYPRFIKSEMYKVYLMREMEGKPLQLPKPEGEEQTGKAKKDKKKSKDKDAEEKDKEKRRRSLLPLPWGKKTSKQNLKVTSDTDLKKQNKEKEKMSVSSSSVTKEVNNNMMSQRKPASGPGIDLSTMRKEVQANTKEVKDKDGTEEKNMKFCRVILPDGSTTVVCTKPGQNIRTVLGRLCEKRSLSIAAVDVFQLGSDKPLDLGEDISTLGSKEVMIERRVLFRMDLPHRKSIGVKAKPNRTVRDVFKPILNKYGFKLDNITVQLSGQTGYVDIDEQVSTIDNQRVVISTIENSGSQDLDSREKEALKGTAEDRPSLGLFGLLRKDSAYGKQASELAKTKTRHKVTFNLQKNQTRKSSRDPDEERFLELLTKAQSSRMDDQRGLGTSASEIPEFLRNKVEYPSGRESAPPILKHDKSHRKGIVGTPEDYVQNENEYFTSYTRGQVSMRPSSVPADSFQDHSSSQGVMDSNDDSYIVNQDQSFSADGVLPSSSEAEVYFQTTDPDSADFDDPRLAEKGLRDLGFDYSYNMYQAKAWGYSRHRPTGLSPTRQKKLTPSKQLVTPTERFSLDEAALLDSSRDTDKTLVGSQLEERPNSLPAAMDRISPRASYSPAVSPFGGYARKSVGENTVNHSTPKAESMTSRYSNHKSAFHAPAVHMGSPITGNTSFSGDMNESQKAMIIDLGSSDENVTFV
ncbi:regulator of G-protein signaling 12-like isoform X2 [Saccostrea echinata]|uniref:regulator of G-protein signaling 12-like isoform X2 n=1 Tax=Saccostrea echinata TaxID=191078 RepID=UPI002A7FFD87|nr:regulator of G-protein signaling 12-like isoform X2 [Saccostrea echinata]